MIERLKNAGTIARGFMILGGALTLRRFRKATQAHPEPSSYIIPPPETLKVERASKDAPYQLRWLHDADIIKIYAGETPDTINHELAITADIDGQSATITTPLAYLRPFFEVEFSSADRVWRELVAERILPLEGAVNFRDLGGYPTESGKRIKWGKIFRSSNLSALTDSDLNFITHLGIKLVCDLRAPQEITKRPDRLPVTNPPEWVNLPVHDDPNPFFNIIKVIANVDKVENLLLNGYADMIIDANPSVFGRIFSRLADHENLPALVHCTAGKDRAGTTAALLLLVLGVPDEIVIADYSLSNAYFEYFRTVMSEQTAPLRRIGITVDDLQPIIVANPNTLRGTIEHIRNKYGSVEAYLKVAGVTDEMLEQLRINLLE